MSDEKTRARQERNAFSQSKTLSLRPPTQQIIDETVRLSNEIAHRIDVAKRSGAVVALVNDLAGIRTKLMS